MSDKDKQGDTQKEVASAVTEPKSKHDDATALLFRSGGAYIPPAKLRKLQAQITDKSSAAYQRIAWEALKKSLNGAVNKANVSNLSNVIRELLHENVIRGRGLLVRSIMKAQSVSPTFAHVYAAMIAVVNTKFPQIGDLLLRRLIMTFKRSFRRNQKDACVSSLRFIAHLINQNVVHEVLALEVCLLLLLQPTDDSVECAVGFLKECGAKLQEVSPRALHSVFERLRDVLHEASLDIRVQYAVEVLFQIRKDGYKEHQPVLPELNLVEEDDQNTHTLRLDDTYVTEDQLDVFKPDPNFEQNEAKYAAIRDEILGEGDSESGSDAEDGESADGESEELEQQQEKAQLIVDRTETDLVELRKIIYLTIQSSLDFQECVHKLMKLKIEENQQGELCSMVLDCCAQLRTYEKFYGLVAQRFCTLNKRFIEHFERLFVEQYSTCHRLETIKLRNVARFFAHLLHTDAISWTVLRCVRLNEEESTSSSRIFLKILFQELAEFLGLAGFHTRLNDPTLAEAVAGVFPRDSPKNTRFAINFLTCIGLGGLTDELREFLRTAFSKPNNDDEQLGEELNRADDDTATGNENLVDKLNAMLAEEQARHGLQKPISEDEKPKAKKSSTKKRASRDRKRIGGRSASQSSASTSSSYSASVSPSSASASSATDSYSSSSESDYDSKRRGNKRKHAAVDLKKQKKRKHSVSRSRSRSGEKGEKRHGKKRKHDKRHQETAVDRSEKHSKRGKKKHSKAKRSPSDESTSATKRQPHERKRSKEKEGKHRHRGERAELAAPAKRYDQTKEKMKRRELTASRSRSRSRSPPDSNTKSKNKNTRERNRRTSASRSPTPRDKGKMEKSKPNQERGRRRSLSRSRSPSPIRDKGKTEKVKSNEDRGRRMSSSRSHSPSPIRDKGKTEKVKSNEDRGRRMSLPRSRSPSPIRDKGKTEKSKANQERGRRRSLSRSRSPSPVGDKGKAEKSKANQERGRRRSLSRSRSPSPVGDKGKAEKSKANQERGRRRSLSRSRSPSPTRDKGKTEKSKANQERGRRRSLPRSRSPSPIRDKGKTEKVRSNEDRGRRMSSSRSRSPSPIRDKRQKEPSKDYEERNRRASYSRSRSVSPAREKAKVNKKDNGERKRRVSASRSRSPTPKRPTRKQEKSPKLSTRERERRRSRS